MNIDDLSAGEARAKIFCSLVMGKGVIARGVLTNQMHISPQTFVHEMRDYLEQYPNIHYNKKNREFSYVP